MYVYIYCENVKCIARNFDEFLNLCLTKIKSKNKDSKNK